MKRYVFHDPLLTPGEGLPRSDRSEGCISGNKIDAQRTYVSKLKVLGVQQCHVLSNHDARPDYTCWFQRSKGVQSICVIITSAVTRVP